MSSTPRSNGVLTIIKEFGDYTSAHGLGRLTAAGHFLGKLFWFCAVVSAFGMFSWQTSRLFAKFYSRPVNVDVKMVFSELEFPAVTMCNLNRFRSDVMKHETPELNKMVEDFEVALANQLSGGQSEKSSTVASATTARVLRRRKRDTNGTTTLTAVIGANTTLPLIPTSVPTTTTTGPTPLVSEDVSTEDPIVDTTTGDLGSGDVTTDISSTATEDVSGDVTTDISTETTTTTLSSTTSALGTTTMTSQTTTTTASGPTTRPTITTSTTQAASTTFTPSPATTSQTTVAPSLYDENEEYFIPTVNITNKPWFNQTNQPDAQMEITKNLTAALTTISASKRRRIGHQVSDMIQECSWHGKQCYPGNFTGFTNRYYGNCYTFNTGINASPVRSTTPGAIHGLRLTLFVEQDLYVTTMSPSAGVRVLIHARDVQPFPEEHGFDMSPGNKYSVGIRLREITRKGPPHGNCSDGDEGTHRLLYKRKYSVTACLRSCAQDHKIARCGCGDPALPIPPGVSVCSETTLPGSTKCIEDIDHEINDKVITCSCPAPCKQRVFVTSVSASEWPAAAYEKVIIQQYSKRSDRLNHLLSQPGGVRQQFLKLELFFEDLNYETITESPAYEEENLLGDIGGQLGLWIGLSILTLVELLELVFKIAMLLFGKDKIQDCQEKPPIEGMPIPMTAKEAEMKTQPDLYDRNILTGGHR